MREPNKPQTRNFMPNVRHYVEKLGWPVFPVNQEKTPLVKGGFKSASTDLDEVKTMFSNPNATGIGIPTGKSTKFFVIDIDGEEGERSLEALQKENGELPETLVQITGREDGGRHLFFEYPIEQEVKNSTSKIGEGIDIRGEGGYVVVPPSTHSSGKKYVFNHSGAPEKNMIAKAPEWLIDLVVTHPVTNSTTITNCTPKVPSSLTTQYGAAALRNQVAEIQQAPDGTRNDTLYKSACSIGQLVAGGEIQEDEAVSCLTNAAIQAGLGHTEVAKTLNSGLKAGKLNPRRTDAPKTYKSKENKVQISDEPIPLVRPLPAEEEYPVDSLGLVLSSAVNGIADIVQVPPALAAGSVLAAASIAVQAHVDVLLPIGSDEHKPASLFLLTIASSSDRKSTADRYAMSGIREFEKKLREHYSVEMQNFEINDVIYKDKKNDLIRRKEHPKGEQATLTELTVAEAILEEIGKSPDSPLNPCIILQEPTFEGLYKLLLNGQPSVGIFSSEGGQMVGGHAMNPDNKLKTSAGLSKLWDGEPIDRIRAGDGYSVLHGRRCSFHLMMQPQVGTKLLSDPVLHDQGLLSRILVTSPTSLVGTREYRISNESSKNAVNEFNKRILEILRIPYPLVQGKQNELNPRPIPLSEDAKQLWINFYNEVEILSGKGNRYEMIKSFQVRCLNTQQGLPALFQ